MSLTVKHVLRAVVAPPRLQGLLKPVPDGVTHAARRPRRLGDVQRLRDRRVAVAGRVQRCLERAGRRERGRGGVGRGGGAGGGRVDVVGLCKAKESRLSNAWYGTTSTCCFGCFLILLFPTCALDSEKAVCRGRQRDDEDEAKGAPLPATGTPLTNPDELLTSPPGPGPAPVPPMPARSWTTRPTAAVTLTPTPPPAAAVGVLLGGSTGGCCCCWLD